MKKAICLLLVLTLASTLLTGCIKVSTINVVSREDGSGTRSAFIEIVSILEKDSYGNETDNTYEEAIILNGTNAIMTTIAGDENSIGYISLGTLNDTVKALKIHNVEATSENVTNGSYKISRPFSIAYRELLSPLAEDFISFIMSSDGQSIIMEEGYVGASTNSINYISSGQEGKLTIAGSTSVSPVMEKLAEMYENLQPKVSIEIQSTGSSAGIQSAIEGSADIGMASRPLKESEKKVLSHKAIAIDGIVVIVNNRNPIESINLDEIKSIFTGEITNWDETK
jgi:phosphate transport system substrate-binding protein